MRERERKRSSKALSNLRLYLKTIKNISNLNTLSYCAGIYVGKLIKNTSVD